LLHLPTLETFEATSALLKTASVKGSL
jgi:hypothetical protein